MGQVLNLAPSAITDLFIFIFLSIPFEISLRVRVSLILISLPLPLLLPLEELEPPKKLSAPQQTSLAKNQLTPCQWPTKRVRTR